MNVINNVKNCRDCALGQGLAEPLCCLTQREIRGRIMLVKFSPDYDCHLLEDVVNTGEKVILDRLISQTNIPFEDIYVTNLIKSECKTTSKKLIKSYFLSCYRHIRDEIFTLQPEKIVLLGNKVKEIFSQHIDVNIETVTTYSLWEIFNSNTKFKKAVEAISVKK